MELLPESISDDTAGQARNLVAAKADVVIGPTDSSRAPAAIDVLSNARIALISPANTAPRAQHLRERRLLLPDRRGRRRPGLRPRQARQGRRRQDAGRRARGRRLRQGPRRGRRVQRLRQPAWGRSPLRDSPRARRTQAAAAAKAAAPDAVVLIARDGCPGRHRGAEQRRHGRARSSSSATVPSTSTAPVSGSRALDGARGILPGVFPTAALPGRARRGGSGLEGHDLRGRNVRRRQPGRHRGRRRGGRRRHLHRGPPHSRLRRNAAGAGGAQPAGAAAACTSYRTCVDGAASRQAPRL